MSEAQRALAHEYLKVILARPLARLFYKRSVKKAYLLAGYFDNFGKELPPAP